MSDPPMRGTVKERLARVEEMMTPMVIEVGALVLLFKLLLDFDFIRCRDLGGDPLRFVIEEDLDEQLDLAREGATDDSQWFEVATLLAAFRIASIENLVPDGDPEPPVGANDD